MDDVFFSADNYMLISTLVRQQLRSKNVPLQDVEGIVKRVMRQIFSNVAKPPKVDKANARRLLALLNTETVNRVVSGISGQTTLARDMVARPSLNNPFGNRQVVHGTTDRTVSLSECRRGGASEASNNYQQAMEERKRLDSELGIARPYGEQAGRPPPPDGRAARPPSLPPDGQRQQQTAPAEEAAFSWTDSSQAGDFCPLDQFVQEVPAGQDESALESFDDRLKRLRSERELVLPPGPSKPEDPRSLPPPPANQALPPTTTTVLSLPPPTAPPPPALPPYALPALPPPPAAPRPPPALDVFVSVDSRTFEDKTLSSYVFSLEKELERVEDVYLVDADVPHIEYNVGNVSLSFRAGGAAKTLTLKQGFYEAAHVVAAIRNEAGADIEEVDPHPLWDRLGFDKKTNSFSREPDLRPFRYFLLLFPNLGPEASVKAYPGVTFVKPVRFPHPPGRLREISVVFCSPDGDPVDLGTRYHELTFRITFR